MGLRWFDKLKTAIMENFKNLGVFIYIFLNPSWDILITEIGRGFDKLKTALRENNR